jgi:hypothetical protein
MHGFSDSTAFIMTVVKFNAMCFYQVITHTYYMISIIMQKWLLCLLSLMLCVNILVMSHFYAFLVLLIIFSNFLHLAFHTSTLFFFIFSKRTITAHIPSSLTNHHHYHRRHHCHHCHHYRHHHHHHNVLVVRNSFLIITINHCCCCLPHIFVVG